MNKTELVAAIAEKAGTSKKDAEKVVNATFDVISEAMAKGDKISLVGFGTFEVRERAAREGKNPQTGATIKIAAVSYTHLDRLPYLTLLHLLLSITVAVITSVSYTHLDVYKRQTLPFRHRFRW